MAGHSQFSNRKHRKARQDGKRAKIFTKISREITIAVKESGDDADFNPRLRLALDNARAENMPNDNINRAIDRGLGKTGDAQFEEFLYEGYGPGGVAFLLEMTSDNRMRAAADIRHAFSKHGGSLGEDGCVSWMFNRKGVIVINDISEYAYDDILLTVLEAGGIDLEEEEGSYLVYTEPGDLYQVRDTLIKSGVKVAESEIYFVPDIHIEMPHEHEKELENLVDDLEDNDDVQNVYTNLE